MGKSYREQKSKERKQERDLHPRRNPHIKLIDEERDLETREQELHWDQLWKDVTNND